MLLCTCTDILSTQRHRKDIYLCYCCKTATHLTAIWLSTWAQNIITSAMQHEQVPCRTVSFVFSSVTISSTSIRAPSLSDVEASLSSFNMLWFWSDAPCFTVKPVTPNGSRWNWYKLSQKLQMEAEFVEFSNSFTTYFYFKLPQYFWLKH